MTRSTQHARSRAGERYMRQMSRRDADAIVAAIKAGRSVSAQRQTHSRSVHVVEHDGRLWRVVYSNLRKLIITCLPIDEEPRS